MRQVCVIVLLLVASAYAFAPASVSPAVAHRGVEAMSKTLKNALSQRPSVTTFATQKFQVYQSGNVSSECQAAVFGVSRAFSQCGAVPATPTQQALEAFCVPACIDGINTAVANVLTVCSNAVDRVVFATEEFEFALRQAQGAVNTMCLKEGDAYCLPVIAAIGGGFDFQTVTEQQLNGMCSPCVHKLAMAAASTGGAMATQAAALDAVCNKIDGQYCLIQTRNAVMTMVGMDPENPDLNAISKAFCNPCFRAMINKMALIDQLNPPNPEDPSGGGAAMEEMAEMFTLVCTRDESGNFCMARMGDIMAHVMSYGEQGPPCAAMDAITPTSPCSAECKTFVAGYLAAGGCCTRAFFSAAGADAPISWAENQCGLTVPQPCQTLRVKGKLVLHNLRNDYVQANRDKVDAAIKNDLANFFDTLPSSIGIKSIGPDTPPPVPAGGFTVQQTAGLAVNYEVVPNDSGHANTISAKARTASTAPLASVAALPIVAREDPSKPLSFDNASEKDVVVEGAAAGLKAGVAVAVAVVAAAVANLF